jgi:hypothetical protein
VGDPGNENDVFGVIHRIDDAVIANADTKVIATREL